MRSMVVVALKPIGSHGPHLGQRIEDVAVQHLGAAGLVEALDIGVLGWLAGVDVT